MHVRVKKHACQLMDALHSRLAVFLPLLARQLDVLWSERCGQLAWTAATQGRSVRVELRRGVAYGRGAGIMGTAPEREREMAWRSAVWCCACSVEKRNQRGRWSACCSDFWGKETSKTIKAVSSQKDLGFGTVTHFIVTCK